MTNLCELESIEKILEKTDIVDDQEDGVMSQIDDFWIDLVLEFIGAQACLRCLSVSRRMYSKVETVVKNSDRKSIAELIEIIKYNSNNITVAVLWAWCLLSPLRNASTTVVALLARVQYFTVFGEAALFATSVQLRMANEAYRPFIMAALQFDTETTVTLQPQRRNVMALPPVCELVASDGASTKALEKLAYRLRSRGEVAVFTSDARFPRRGGGFTQERTFIYVVNSVKALDDLDSHPHDLRRRLRRFLPPVEPHCRAALWGIITVPETSAYYDALSLQESNGKERPEDASFYTRRRDFYADAYRNLGKRISCATAPQHPL